MEEGQTTTYRGKLYRLYFFKVIKVNISSKSHVDNMHLRYDVIKMSLYLCGLPSTNNLIMRKTSDQS
jgi:hypothetical protein